MGARKKKARWTTGSPDQTSAWINQQRDTGPKPGPVEPPPNYDDWQQQEREKYKRKHAERQEREREEQWSAKGKKKKASRADRKRKKAERAANVPNPNAVQPGHKESTHRMGRGPGSFRPKS